MPENAAHTHLSVLGDLPSIHCTLCWALSAFRNLLTKGRFQVFFGGKFCYQFYFVMKMENLITTLQAKWLLNGTSAPRRHPCPG